MFALGLLVSAPLLAKKQELPEITEDGLHLVPDSRMAIVYAEPGADLAQYQRIQLHQWAARGSVHACLLLLPD